VNKLTHQQLAQRIARDIPEGAYVNLGIGMPTQIANYLPPDREIFLHSENGILGMGPAPAQERKIPNSSTPENSPSRCWRAAVISTMATPSP
jgi:3-oxoadipate CoA-transferase beta subunit